MKCPECDTRITTKHYDAAYEWFECPKCEGCFTYDEILEGGAEEETKGKVVAKGKKRQAEIQEDEEAIAEYEKEIVTKTVKQESHTRHRDEVDTVAVVNIWGDEIQDIYSELGVSLDEMNAQDKALILWREIHHLQGVSARDQEVPHALCKEHS